MTTADTANLFAVLLILGGAAVIATAVMARRLLARWGLVVAAVFAVSATAGSLWFSEVAGFEPCELCWFQRVFMYPLAVVLPLAALRGRRAIAPYALTLVAIGFAISAYHVVVQLWPDTSTSCDLDNPCSARWIDALGFITIPMMAGLSFALIGVGLVAARHGD